MDKMEKVKKLYVAIQKARAVLIEENAKDWFSRFDTMPWHDEAVNGYVTITQGLAELLQNWQKEAVKAINTPKIYKDTQTVEKAGKTPKYRTEEYLDARYNKVVVDDIRDVLAELQEKYASMLGDFFERQIAGGTANSAIKLANGDIPFNFNKHNPFVKKYLEEKKIHWAKAVADTTEGKIKSILVDGCEKGLSSYDVGESIKNSTGFSTARAESIARTESMIACNYADYTRGFISNDVVGNIWRSAQNSRTRLWHKMANGQYRVTGKAFDVGGMKLLYPGDHSQGAKAKDIVNCRCWLEAVFSDEVDSTAGKAKTLGEIDVDDKNAVDNFLIECQNNIREEQIEHAFAITALGSLLYTVGNEYSIGLEHIGAENLQGSTVVHNHPNMCEDDGSMEVGGSFSIYDLEAYIQYGIKEIRVSDGRYNYVLRIEGMTVEELRELYAEAEINVKEMPPSYWNTEGFEIKHETVKRMSEIDNRIDYGREYL